MGGSGVRGPMRGLIGALLPVQYAGCRAWDEVLCPSCRFLAGCPAHVASLEGVRGPLPLVAIGDYDGPLCRIVLAAKYSVRTDVADLPNEAGACLGTALGGVLGMVGSPATGMGSLEGRSSFTGEAVEVWVVPAPSLQKRRLRGRQVVLPLARAVARALVVGARSGVRVRVVDAVQLRVGATSQSGKVGAQHTVGRMGSMRMLVVPGYGVRVAVADDVVTTGATVREMERVLDGLDAVMTLCRTGLIS